MSWFERIYNIGVSDDLPETEVRKIKLYNRLGVISAVLLSFYPILFMYFKIYYGFYLVALAFLAIIIPLVMQYMSLNRLARITAVILANTSFYLGVIIFGFNSGFHYGIIPLTILPILYFYDNKTRIWIYSILIIEAVILFFLFRNQIPLHPLGEVELIFNILLYISILMLNILYLRCFDIISDMYHTSNEKLLKELTKRNEELKDFSFTTSHDIKQPLRTISSFSALLKRKAGHKLDPKEVEYLEFIEEGSKRLNDVLNAILDHSVLGENYKFENTDVDELVRNVIIDLDKLISENKASIKYTDLPVIKANGQKLYIVFQNLLSNAIKFRNHYRPCQIEISSKDLGSHKQFLIKDNGLGIDESLLNDIFKIFKKGHTDLDIEGRGIGLANCKKIVAMHGGKIWVESALGEGSQFYFTIQK